MSSCVTDLTILPKRKKVIWTNLVKLANGRVDIAVGGGLRIKDASALARATGASHFHGSLRRSEASKMQHERRWVLEDADSLDGTSRFVVDSADVLAMIENLRSS